MTKLPDVYLLLKYLHVSCVCLSGLGFLLRGLLTLRGSSLLRRRWVRVFPHVNDTLLLGAALGLAAMSNQFPFVQAWLTAKVLGLCVYIILGSIALKADPKRSPLLRTAAYCAALVVFAWIVSVALSKYPAGILTAAG